MSWAVKSQLLWVDCIAAAVGGVATWGLRMVCRAAILDIEFGTVGTGDQPTPGMLVRPRSG